MVIIYILLKGLVLNMTNIDEKIARKIMGYTDEKPTGGLSISSWFKDGNYVCRKTHFKPSYREGSLMKVLRVLSGENKIKAESNNTSWAVAIINNQRYVGYGKDFSEATLEAIKNYLEGK